VTIAGMVTVTPRIIVAGFMVWLMISAALIAAYLGLMKALGVL
jgi:hypothetical protein